jgi:hypothetical protein
MASRYGKKSQQKVKRAMRERKSGTLRSGRSGQKVTSRKQAIAIGLSEARREGGKVPAKRSSRRRTRAKSTSGTSRGRRGGRGRARGGSRSGSRSGAS